jgi:hypothetical protein
VKPRIGLTQALLDPHLFGGVFANPSFWTWKTLARVIDGLPLVEQRERDLYKLCTGVEYRPGRRARRLIVLAGRRAGKDRFFSAAACWVAALCADWRKHISPGEGAVVILLGGDRKQASILSRYCAGLLATPLLKREIARQTTDTIEFKNGASLEIATSDSRLVRGRSAIALFGSEISYWQTAETSVSSDEEVVAAALPSLSMAPDGGLMAMWSSVHRKRGYAYRKYKQLFGVDGADDADLIWFAPSTVMNPLLPQSEIDRALAEDAPRARAEFLNEWRSDLSDFIPADVIEACTDFGVYERPPRRGVNYVCFIDAAGGTGADSFSLCIAHADARCEIDVLRERKPRFVPAQVIAEWAPLIRSYGILEVEGDKFAGGFHSSEWHSYNIAFKPCERTTSENYLSALPVFLANRVRLLDYSTLRHQLSTLERRVGAGDRESVSHPQHASAHDDCATSCCGAIAAIMRGDGSYYDSSYSGFQDPVTDRDLGYAMAQWARETVDSINRRPAPAWDCPGGSGIPPPGTPLT